MAAVNSREGCVQSCACRCMSKVAKEWFKHVSVSQQKRCRAGGGRSLVRTHGKPADVSMCVVPSHCTLDLSDLLCTLAVIPLLHVNGKCIIGVALTHYMLHVLLEWHVTVTCCLLVAMQP